MKRFLTALALLAISSVQAAVIVVEGASAPQQLVIDEDFATDPLANDENPYYDDGTNFDQCTPSGASGDWLCYQWTESDIGSNGLDSLRAHFLTPEGDPFPLIEFEVRFDFRATSNFDDVNPGNTGPHLFDFTTNLDGLYGDNTKLYLEPDGDGCFWVDINKSDEPSTWEEIRDTACVDVFDGATHAITARFKANTFGNADGSIEVWVGETQVVDDTTVEVFIFEDQYFQRIAFAPYIVGGSNSATGAVGLFVDNLEVEAITAAPNAPLTNPGTVQFNSATYSVQEDNETVTVQVDRSGGSDGTITVDVSDTEGTATEPEDYTNPDQTLTFLEGVTTQTFDLTVVDDASTEGDQTLTLALSGVTGGGSIGATDETVVTIQDPAAPPEVGSLLVDWPTAAYGASEIVFTVRIEEVQGEDVPFDYATSNTDTGDGFAAAGTDYTATSGSSTIPAGLLYRQIAVPIAGNTPPTGRDQFTFTVTDADENDTVVQGLIVNAYYVHSFDYPSVGAGQKEGWVRSGLSGSWTTPDLTPTNGSASIGSTVPCAVGVNCLRHNMLTSSGAQATIGVDTLASINVGSIFDNGDYYYKWYMRIEPGFIWNGSNQDKMKIGRLYRTNSQNPLFSSPYIDANDIRWEWSFPNSGGSSSNSVRVPYNWDNFDDGEWHEIIWYQHRESAYEAEDGISRFVVDCVLVDTQTDISWTEPGESLPGDGVTGVRVSNMGFPGFFQNQIGDSGETTGGVVYTDDYVLMNTWPSAQCARPW